MNSRKRSTSGSMPSTVSNTWGFQSEPSTREIIARVKPQLAQSSRGAASISSAGVLSTRMRTQAWWMPTRSSTPVRIASRRIR